LSRPGAKPVVVKSTSHIVAAFGPIAPKVFYVDPDGSRSGEFQGESADLAVGSADHARPDRVTSGLS